MYVTASASDGIAVPGYKGYKLTVALVLKLALWQAMYRENLLCWIFCLLYIIYTYMNYVASYNTTRWVWDKISVSFPLSAGQNTLYVDVSYDQGRRQRVQMAKYIKNLKSHSLLILEFFSKLLYTLSQPTKNQMMPNMKRSNSIWCIAWAIVCVLWQSDHENGGGQQLQ